VRLLRPGGVSREAMHLRDLLSLFFTFISFPIHLSRDRPGAPLRRDLFDYDLKSSSWGGDTQLIADRY
jgi:hypothetical protein